MMGAAALLCVLSLLEAVAGSYVMTDSTIRTAVAEWLSDSAAAEAMYGHISTWETGGVTDMAYLFCAAHDDDMAACLACVNMECEGNEQHSEICSDCFGEDCDECAPGFSGDLCEQRTGVDVAVSRMPPDSCAEGWVGSRCDQCGGCPSCSLLVVCYMLFAKGAARCSEWLHG